MTREEHLAWCKEQALAYCEADDFSNALVSMGSDLDKHPETANHPNIKIGFTQLMAGMLQTREEMRRFINGFR